MAGVDKIQDFTLCDKPVQPSLPSLCGQVWFDANKDNVKDSSELKYTGAAVRLTYLDLLGKEVQTKPTITYDNSHPDHPEKYCFHDLPAGNYKVCLDDSIGTLSNEPQSNYKGTDACKDVTMTSVDKHDVDFPLTKLQSLCGKTWFDSNGNQVLDAGE